VLRRGLDRALGTGGEINNGGSLVFPSDDSGPRVAHDHSIDGQAARLYRGVMASLA
jgi:hypothetical protein